MDNSLGLETRHTADVFEQLLCKSWFGDWYNLNIFHMPIKPPRRGDVAGKDSLCGVSLSPTLDPIRRIDVDIGLPLPSFAFVGNPVRLIEVHQWLGTFGASFCDSVVRVNKLLKCLPDLSYILPPSLCCLIVPHSARIPNATIPVAFVYETALQAGSMFDFLDAVLMHTCGCLLDCFACVAKLCVLSAERGKVSI